MALDDDIRILSGVGLFEIFTDEQLRLLAFGAENVRLEAGEVLFHEREAADSAFIVVDGLIRLYRERDGERVGLRTVGPLALLGELALIADTRRPTDAAAVQASDLIKLNRRLFRRILEEYPQVAIALHQRIVRDLDAMAAEIARLGPRFSDKS